MHQKSDHDFREEYPYVHVVILVSMRITVILTKDIFFLILKTHNIEFQFSKVVKKIIVAYK